MSATSLHDRLSHQPKAPEDHSQPNAAELKAAFRKTIAVVIAYDEETTPLQVHADDLTREPVLCKGLDGKEAPRPLQLFEGKPVIYHTLELLHACGFAAIYTLTKIPEVESLVKDVALNHSDAPCEVVSFSKAEALAKGGAGDTFEVIGVTKPIFDLCAKLARQIDGCDRIMVLRADGVRLRPWHLMQLNRSLDSDSDAEIVTSWIAWLRRLPMLFTTAFASEIDKRGLSTARDNGACLCPWRPLPNLPLDDVVFGEERLESNLVIPLAADSFIKEHRLSALEAVRLAHRLHDAKESANFEAVEEIESQIRSLSEVDAMLLDEACAVVASQQLLLGSDGDLFEQVAEANKLGLQEKGCFPIFATKEHEKSLVYLDTAATSQRLGCALDAEYRFNAYENANIYRGAYELSAEATATYNDAHAVIERFINSDRRQIVMTLNDTQSLNLIAQAWGEHNIHAGDVIITALNEHHSDILPWMMLAQRKGAHLRYIGINDDGTLDLDEYAELLKEGPKLVCIAEISNVIGLRNPIECMARMAHEVGARFVVDAAQSIPHIPVDVKALGADFVTFSGHKLYGPFGIGCLWISPEAFVEMDPLGAGGGTVSHVSKGSYYLRQGAIQYEMGTPPIAQAVGLAAACKHLETVGMDRIAAHDRALTRYLMSGLRELDFLTVWGDHEGESGEYGLVALSVLGADAGFVGRLMGEMGVAVRSGGHCALPLSASMGLGGTTRISFGIHTTTEDIDAALAALRVCGKLLGVA